jgi:hypothetical protein
MPSQATRPRSLSFAYFDHLVGSSKRPKPRRFGLERKYTDLQFIERSAPPPLNNSRKAYTGIARVTTAVRGQPLATTPVNT